MIDQLTNRNIVLVSRSPRRRQLLEGMGLKFRVDAVETAEIPPEGANPVEVAEILALEKAEAYAEKYPESDDLIITADTIVVLGNEILGKPGDRFHAKEMLRTLSGCTHDVITGVCLAEGKRRKCFHSASKVSFKALKEDEIDYYIDTFKPYDKAGSYGIQEWIGLIGVEKLTGSYFNVMGLPTARLWEELNRFAANAE